jgi:hypothetical protein
MELRAAALLLGMAAISSIAQEARAEQFILFDATIDYTWDQAVNSKPSKSHFYVNEGNFLNKERPDNWLSPIDYRNGTLHVRTEVLEKPPGDQQVGWTLCYIPNSGGYGCADTTYYKSTGVFDRDTDMTDWWNNDQLNWEQGVKQMDLIYAINDSGSGHVSNYPELKDLTTPTKVRITMVQVSKGSTYDPSSLNLPGVAGAGGAGGAAGGAGTGAMAGMGGALLPMAGAAGSGTSGDGMGGLLGTGGAGSAGTPSTSGGAGASAMGVAGSTSLPSAAGGAASAIPPGDTTSEAGCAVSNGGRAGVAFGVALAALLLSSRRRASARLRVLRRS